MVDDRTKLMSARALSPGYEILWYTIDRILGQGGFGITYLARDRNLDRAVAIKEYLPISFAYRHDDFTVKPITNDHGESFSWGLSSFLKEAQTLARFSHPNIVRVHSVFEQNSTAYMVMEYEHGQDLSTIYKDSERLEQPFFEQIFFPIMDGLKEIHKFDFIHRDIKPANIYIREDGTPVLIDFGSARQTTTQQTSEITTLVSQGYTPLEQYSPNYGDQGPWTDIYALAATIYEGLVGRKPDESLSRSACLMRGKPDLLLQLDASDYPGCGQRFLNAVFAGLKLEPEGRPQNLEEWQNLYKDGNDIFDPNPATSAFTALIDPDTTVLRPLNESYSTEVPTNRPVLDDVPATDNDQPEADKRPGKTIPAGAMPADSLQNKDSGKKRTGLLVAALALVAVMAGGAYFLLGENSAPASLSAATLSKMSKPAQASVITLPTENALAQLSDMTRLAPLLTQAYALNENDPALLKTMRATEASLVSLATKWNATKHADIAAKISSVSSALPTAAHDQTRIQSIQRVSNPSAAYAQVLALLDSEQYLKPAGNSVLDKITSVSETDYQKLKNSTQWAQMMSEFSRIALEKLAQSQFDDAARLTEAALTIDAENPEFKALRTFLSGS